MTDTGICIRGIENGASFCYMIAVIQILRAFDLFNGLISRCLATGKDDFDAVPNICDHIRALAGDNYDGETDVDEFHLARIHDLVYGDSVQHIDCQRDATEFLALLAARVLQSTGSDADGILGGQVVNAFNATDSTRSVKYRLEKTERFIFTTLPLRASLLRSLHDFTEAEVLSFRWQQHQRATESPAKNLRSEEKGGGGNQTIDLETSKTTKFRRSLPSILIFQLKRFAFDLTTLTTRKRFDKVEFPVRLDMSPFCVTDSSAQLPISAQCTDVRSLQFRLKGVLMHEGATTVSGHYFSYVRQVDPTGRDVTWCECDDDAVSTAFCCKDGSARESEFLQSLCGVDVDSVAGDLNEEAVAIMLFYEKIDCR